MIMTFRVLFWSFELDNFDWIKRGEKRLGYIIFYYYLLTIMNTLLYKSLVLGHIKLFNKIHIVINICVYVYIYIYIYINSAKYKKKTEKICIFVSTKILSNTTLCHIDHNEKCLLSSKSEFLIDF